MTDTRFPQFHEAFPPGGPRIPFDPARHADLAARVPEAVATEWRGFGFGAYGGGLLWTPVPDEPLFDPADWPQLDGTGIEVLRTAFAGAFFWQGGNFLWLNPITGKTAEYPPSAPLLFETALTEEPFREYVLMEPLFSAARQRLGDLGRDECFGFAPLPALGGAVAEEYVVKVRMRDYLAMVAQVLN